MLFTLCCFFLLRRSLAGQTPQEPHPPQFASARIYYTGDLFGYIRWPDQQVVTDVACPTDPNRANVTATTFLAALAAQPGNKILVGVGNNFAPELFSRLVDPALGGHNKDTLVWDYLSSPPAWRTVDVLEDPKYQALSDDIAEGNSRIPMDNVGCFLSQAGYAAVIPGKQDFHYGPERLRQLARFLASRDNSGGFKPVQILAANLVIQTTVDDAAKRIPFRDKMPVPPYSNDKADLKPDLSDGDGVLPWLREIKIANVPLSSSKVAICEVQDRTINNRIVRDPEYVPNFLPDLSSCHELTRSGDVFRIPDPVSGQDTFLTPNNDYWLCVSNIHHSNSPADHRPYCQHFSVYSPFFMYPNPVTRPGLDSPRRGTVVGSFPTADGGYLDPKPYVLVKPDNGSPESEVAIFGVVDPKLNEDIGRLNDEWTNPDKHRSTQLMTIVDPVLALKQLLQYFEADYKARNSDRAFRGTKVLLAQLPKYEAERIATVMKGIFGLVISQAQREYATPEQSEDLSVHHEPILDSSSRSTSWTLPTFVVAPAPFYDGAIQLKSELEIRIASAEITRQNQCGATDLSCEEHWLFENRVAREELPKSQVALFSSGQFASTVSAALSSTPLGIAAPGSALEQFQQLTLELMQTATDADISMLQKRDFFPPYVDQQPGALDLQQTLDRVFWKDDFVIRILVRGDVLKSVMERSKQFDADDKLTLSLSQEQNRGLLSLGILFDSVTNQYFVHGEKLDSAKIYSIAASDYVGLGDTGYSDLITPPVGHPLKPSEFANLLYISGLVCKQIRDNVAGFNSAQCNDGPIEAKNYFDQLNQQPFDTTKGLTPGEHFLTWARFQKRRPSLYQGQTPLEKAVQQYPLWTFSLTKLAVGFTMNQHNNGTEANLATLFAGVPNTQVNAPNTNTTSLDLSSRVQRNSQKNSFFGQIDTSYSKQLTRQNDATNSDLEAQLKNLLAVESGILPRLYPKTKEIPDLKILLSGRLETQFAPPLISFKVNSTPPALIKQKTGRTKTLQAKIGLRLDNEKSYIESGYAIGEVLGSPLSFTFNPGSPNAVTCTATGAKKQVSLASCIKMNSTPPSGLILPTSIFSETTRTVYQNGLFLNFKLNVPLPLSNNLTYTMESHGQFFFNHRGDVSVDTKYQEDWSHSLVVPLFGNLSFVPKFEMFFYENKVDRNYFYAIQPSLTLQYSFDWHRGLPWWKSMAYQAPLNVTPTSTGAAGPSSKQ